MRLSNIEQVNDFIAAVDKAKHEVWLMSTDGNRFNLKSNLSRYVALGALLSEAGRELELYCASKEDEGYFLNFFSGHEDAL